VAGAAGGGAVEGGVGSLPIDLARPGDDPWTHLRVPDGWREVARLAREVAGDLEALADHVVRCIEVEMPGYVHDAVPVEDLHASVTRNVEMILVGVAEHRRPTEAELAIRRELGVRRAVQGMPVDGVIAAYHVGHRELWQALVRRLPADDDGRAARQLLESATTVWAWVTDVTDAIAAAHARTTRRLEARVVGARQRFVELLVGGDLDGVEADRLARTLGFASDEPFRVAVVRGGSDDRDALDLQRAVDELDGCHVVVARGALVVVVWQGSDPRDLIAATRRVVRDATVAVGARRSGLRGARESLVDAELTLEVTDAGDHGSFDDAWLWATLTASEDRLAAVLADGVAVARAHPHLAQAVLAFGEHGFSVADAARHLEVHANTVAYRLDRWAGLTGWDTRTFPGLVRSLAALHAVHGGRGPSVPDADPVDLADAAEVDGGHVGADEAPAAAGDA
jgi:hypothetical protein